MKRDLDLIRTILLEVETNGSQPQLAQVSADQVLYHYALAIEAGLIDGNVVHGSRGEIVGAVAQKLTWEGHDFLDAVRSDEAWKTVVKKIAAAGGGWTFELAKTLGLAYAKEKLGL